MKTIKFDKTECGVDILLNVLPSDELIKRNYFDGGYKTDFFEIIFFKKGKGAVSLNHEYIDIKDNSVLFISKYQERKWNLDTSELDVIVLIFQEDFLNDFFSDKLFTYKLLYFYQFKHPLVILIDAIEMEKYLGLLREIKDELYNFNNQGEHIIRSLLYYILQTLNRIYQRHNHVIVGKGENYCAFQFKQLLEQNIQMKHRVQDYSDQLGISRITLNKAVKEQFGQTAIQLLNQRLLTEIKQLLLYSGKSVSEIAYVLNFSEPNHMMRFFKAQSGQTSSEFLSQYK